jgi:hypothetical protein
MGDAVESTHTHQLIVTILDVKGRPLRHLEDIYLNITFFKIDISTAYFEGGVRVCTHHDFCYNDRLKLYTRTTHQHVAQFRRMNSTARLLSLRFSIHVLADHISVLDPYLWDHLLERCDDGSFRWKFNGDKEAVDRLNKRCQEILFTLDNLLTAAPSNNLKQLAAIKVSSLLPDTLLQSGLPEEIEKMVYTIRAWQMLRSSSPTNHIYEYVIQHLNSYLEIDHLYQYLFSEMEHYFDMQKSNEIE